MSVPTPPSNLKDRTIATHIVRVNGTLSRFYKKPFDPIYFDRSDSGRLNAPNGDYGVLYAAESRRGSFAESFLRRTGSTMVARDFISERAHVELQVMEELKLVKLFGNGLARLGATAEVIHSSPPYGVPQGWSAAFHSHKGLFDGIAYSSRHNDDEICVALFERAKHKVEEFLREEDLDQDWFYELADHHGVSIAPQN